VSIENLPPSNLVFLIDVSGSMADANKLPLLKSAFRLLVDQLRPQDQVTIVVYAGAAGLVLPPTAGDQKGRILEVLDRLEAGGSTAGAQGIQLAYRAAQESFIPDGNNRVILATDGDFNVGVSSDAELIRLIEEKRDQGIFLTVLGFGMGNYKDAKMEKLADHGNGHYAYIDNLLEGKKVLVTEMGGTLLTIAKDVKIQIEFNPKYVKAYRLIGYENRLLADEDFRDDKKDAGELGAGHAVTALYQIVPPDGAIDMPDVDPLKYQSGRTPTRAAEQPELMEIKLRYKEPRGIASREISQPVRDEKVVLTRTSHNFRFAAAVAAFGMVLRESEYRGEATLDLAARLAEQATGRDPEGYRAEFIRLVKASKGLSRN
jgi:Ca-activated chloride channel family protein